MYDILKPRKERKTQKNNSRPRRLNRGEGAGMNDKKTYIRQIDGKWYAFAGDEVNVQVYSVGPDSPEGGWFCGSWTDNGIKQAAHWGPCKTRSGAYKKAKKYGEYCGIG